MEIRRLDLTDLPPFLGCEAGSQLFGGDQARHVGDREFDREFMQIQQSSDTKCTCKLVHIVVALLGIEQMKEARVHHRAKLPSKPGGF